MSGPAAPIGVGIIGYGFMGSTHARAYQAAHEAGCPCRLVAIADRGRAPGGGASPDPAAGNIDVARGAADLSGVLMTDDAERVIAHPGVGLVSVCTPTDTHVDLAMRALGAGRHVLIEKPVAVRTRDVERLAMKASSTGVLCMPAMCMRHWPAWAWIRLAIQDGRFGAVSSMSIQRLGARPGWSRDFYGDEARCGGMIADLHIHDTDFVAWCFGLPWRVRVAGHRDHITTLYEFDNGSGPTHVAAEGAWDLDPSAPFVMRCRVVFERGTADFELGRTPELLVHADGTTSSPSLEPISGYDGQIRALLDAIARGERAAPTTMDEAVAVARLLDAERRSLDTGAAVAVER